MMDNMSIADAMALRNDGNNGFGDNGAFWLVLLFLFFGMGGAGFNQHGFGGAATAATQQEILLGQQFEGVHNKLNSIGQGICDSTFALNNTITSEGRSLQNQIAECCCNTQLAIKGLEAKMDANEIQNLRDKVTDLQLRASQCDQNAYLVNQLRPCPMPAYLTPNPYCNYNPCGCGGFGPGCQPNI